MAVDTPSVAGCAPQAVTSATLTYPATTQERKQSRHQNHDYARGND